MEKLSKGVLLKRMEEEYGPLLSTANSSVVSSASTSRRNEFPDLSTSSVRQSCPVRASIVLILYEFLPCLKKI